MAENPKIIVLSEQLRGQSFELIQERYTVGRSEDCDICIPDPTISGHHCTLVRDTGSSSGYLVEDEGSTNGTRVNGVRIKDSQELVNSDIVQVGAIEMLFDSEQKGATSAASTQTGINLETTAGTTTISEVPNFSPFASGSGLRSGQSKGSTAAIAAVIGVLVIAVLVVLGMLLYRLLFSA